jgi:hypothetical protein
MYCAGRRLFRREKLFRKGWLQNEKSTGFQGHEMKIGVREPLFLIW